MAVNNGSDCPMPKPPMKVGNPNGMGRVKGGPRGHREMPRPIIPTPIQRSQKSA